MSCRDLAITKKRHLRRSSRAACGILDKETHLDLYNTTLTLRRDTHKPHRLSNNAAESKTPSDHKNMVFRVFFPSYAMESQECSQNKPKHQPHALHSGYLILNLSLMYVNTEWSFRNLKGPKWHTFQDVANLIYLIWGLNSFITSACAKSKERNRNVIETEYLMWF